MQAPIVTNETVKLPSGLTRTTTFTRSVTLGTAGDPLSLTALNDTLTVNGRVFKTAYNSVGRVLTSTSAAGRPTSTTLDVRGRILQEQVADLAPTTYTYDRRGRLETATDAPGPDARTTTLAYDQFGNVATVTDPLGHKVSFTYDAVGRRVTQTSLTADSFTLTMTRQEIRLD